MTRETSLYLDVLRFLAAFTVFLGHVSGVRLTGGFLWQFGPFMGEAVAVFFVLSGFVIGYVTSQREKSASSYVVARAARIYSVAVPALILTFALDAIGRNVHPDFYSSTWGYVAAGRPWQFISGLLFLNQIWCLSVPQGSDLPYWSLGYEVWYYVIFGISVFAHGRWRIAGVLGLLLFVGPPIGAMFPLWLIGVFSYRVCAKVPINRVAGATLCLASIVLWVSYEVLARHYGRPDSVPQFLRRPELFQDYIVGLLFSAHVIGFHAISTTFGPTLNLVARPIRWIAGTTFTVYLFHVPVSQFLTTLIPWPPSFWATRLIIIGGTLGIMFAIAEVTERRKELWRRGFGALLSWGDRVSKVKLT